MYLFFIVTYYIPTHNVAFVAVIRNIKHRQHYYLSTADTHTHTRVRARDNDNDKARLIIRV